MGNWHASLPLVSARLSEKHLHLHHRFASRWSGAVCQSHISGSTPGVGAASEGRSFPVGPTLGVWRALPLHTPVLNEGTNVSQRVGTVSEIWLCVETSDT